MMTITMQLKKFLKNFPHKLQNFFANFSSQKIAGLALLLIIGAAIPLTVTVLHQETNVEQHASSCSGFCVPNGEDCGSGYTKSGSCGLGTNQQCCIKTVTQPTCGTLNFSYSTCNGGVEYDYYQCSQSGATVLHASESCGTHGCAGNKCGTGCQVGFTGTPYCCNASQGTVGYQCQGYQNADCSVTPKQISTNPYPACEPNVDTCTTQSTSSKEYICVKNNTCNAEKDPNGLPLIQTSGHCTSTDTICCASSCGNGTCDNGETHDSCPADCPAPPPSPTSPNNGTGDDNGTTNPTPTPGDTNVAPKGNLEQVSCTSAQATGWACDSSDYSQPIAIHFYSDPHFQTFVGAAQQISIPRESAVGTQCGGHTNHGFTFQVPSSLKDGNPHTLYAYAINYPTDPSNNPSIGNKSFTCTATGTKKYTCSNNACVEDDTHGTFTNSSCDNSCTPTVNQDIHLSLALQLMGVGKNGNLSPKHSIRSVHIQLYKKGDDPTQPNITPVVDLTNITVTYDTNKGYFLNASIDMGKTLPAGDYQILVKTPGYLRKEITDGQGGKVFTLTPGQTTTPPTVQLIAGDVAPLYNKMDISDFYAIVDCYKDKANSASCTAGSQITDLNDDGVIDGIDLNMWLLGFQALQQTNNTSGLGSGIPGQ